MKIDIHAHTKKSKSGESDSRNVDVKKFGEVIRSSDVKILAITNHNHFDLAQYEQFKQIIDGICQIWPGIELDILENGRNAHLIVIVNPMNSNKFDNQVQKLLNGRSADNFTTSLKETINSFDELDCIYIPHYYAKKPDLGDEDIEVLMDLVSNKKRVLKESTNSISAGIYIRHGHNSIYGLDVHNWDDYISISKNLPELRLPVESFEQFCLLLEKDEATINTLLEKKTKEGHDFAFTNLLTCPECGCAITAQYAKQGKYIYYRCSKRKGQCSQPYLRDIHLIEQLREQVDRIALPEEMGEIMLAEIDMLERKEQKEQQAYLKILNQKVKEIDSKMDKLINTFLDENMEQDAYLKKKDELLKEKVGYQEKIKDYDKKGAGWFELSREFVETATHAHSIKTTDDLYELKSFVKKIGSNRHLGGKKVILDLVSPLDLIPKYFPYEVKERLGIKRIPGTGENFSDYRLKNKKTARQERLNLVETEKVSLCRRIVSDARMRLLQQKIDNRKK